MLSHAVPCCPARYRKSNYQSKDIAHVQKSLAQRMADKVGGERKGKEGKSKVAGWNGWSWWWWVGRRVGVERLRAGGNSGRGSLVAGGKVRNWQWRRWCE